MAVELHKHQQKAVEELKNGCILNGAVGTGKTHTALAYWFTKVCGGTLPDGGSRHIGEFKTPKDVYVFTTAKKRNDLDWQKVAADFAISPNREDSWGNVKIVVDSWNNITNYVDIKDAFIIADEQRLVGSGAWVKAFLKMAKNNEWIMLSATPGDHYMDYCPVFIANGFFKNKTEFNDKHVIWQFGSKFPKIKGYQNTGVLEKMRRDITVEMPFTRHTVRHLKNVIVDHDKELMLQVEKKRWHIYEERPIRDVGELFRVMRKLVNSNVSRIAAILDIYKKHKRLIIFYNFNFELEMLRTLGPHLDIPLAEWNGQKHQDVPTGDNWIYLVQYTAGSEGWNCIDTDATIFFSLTYSYKHFEQAQGRIDRLNTPYTDLYYYVLRSSAKIDTLINKALVNKQNFNEGQYNAAW